MAFVKAFLNFLLAKLHVHQLKTLEETVETKKRVDVNHSENIVNRLQSALTILLSSFLRALIVILATLSNYHPQAYCLLYISLY